MSLICQSEIKTVIRTYPPASLNILGIVPRINATTPFVATPKLIYCPKIQGTRIGGYWSGRRLLAEGDVVSPVAETDVYYIVFASPHHKRYQAFSDEIELF